VLDVQPGYIGYVQSSLGSFFEVLDSVAPMPEKKQDVKEVIAAMEKHAEGWRVLQGCHLGRGPPGTREVINRCKSPAVTEWVICGIGGAILSRK